ncbi:MAG: hypothetical protein EA425_13330 [Puniceicoccaceae bacterium]|nr:MAG: hypothetical protein EA425_13330 [Puniceicoccaceae bacterium]
MELLTAVLCDSAADYNGKLCILGAFDTIWARRFPAVHPHCSIAVRILFRDTDEGTHQLHLALVDPDGKSMLPGGGPRINFEIRQIPEQTFFLTRNFVINLQGMPLQSPAVYSIDLRMDDTIIARIPLQVVELKQPPGAHGPQA